MNNFGKSISVVEISHISLHGIWIYVNGHEYFLNYKEYPWFKNATVFQLHNVKLIRNHYLRWENLDVDLELESLRYPEKYPLVYNR